MSIKSGFKMMALALIIAIAGSLTTISNLHAGGAEPQTGERWAGPAIEGTLIISLGEDPDTLTFAGKCKNQACPEIGVVLAYTLGTLPADANDLLYAEVDAVTTENIPNITDCHALVDLGAGNIMRMGINEVITFQLLDGPDAGTEPDRVVAQVKLLFIVPE